MATPLSTISDAAVRDWTPETVTAAKLENDPAAIKVAINLILDYAAELEVNFAATSAPADIATGMLWMNTGDNRLELRRSGSQETVLTENTFGSASIAAGGGTAKHRGAGKIFGSSASASAAGATGALIYATLSANTLNATTQTLQMVGWGTKSGSSSAATMDVFFGGVNLGTLGMSANCTDWHAEVFITYTSGTGQDVAAAINLNRDDTGRTDLCFTGTGTAAATASAAFGFEASSVGATDTLNQLGVLIFHWG